MKTLKGTTYQSPKPLFPKVATPALKSVSLPKAKFSTVSTPKILFPNLKQDVVNEVANKIKTTSTLKGTQPVVAGDPRYSQFYKYNQFGQLSTNINLNDPNVQKTVLQKMVDNGTLPKDVLDKLKPQAGWLERLLNVFALADPYEWIGVLWDAAVTPATKRFAQDVKAGKENEFSIDRGLNNLMTFPRVFGNAAEKIVDDLDGVFGDGYRDKADRWKVIASAAQELKTVNEVLKANAGRNDTLKTLSDLTDPIVSILESEVDLPLVGKQKISGIADMTASIATNFAIDPFTILSKLGILKPLTRKFTIFQSAKSAKFTAGIEDLTEKLLGFVTKEHPNNWIIYLDKGIRELPGLEKVSILGAIDQSLDGAAQLNQARKAVSDALMAYHGGLAINPKELLSIIMKDPEQWVKKAGNIKDVTKPEFIEKIISKFNSAPEATITAQLSQAGDDILKKLGDIENQLPKNADNFDMLIKKIASDSNVKMRQLIKDNPDLLYDASKDIFDPKQRLILQAAGNQEKTNLLKELYSNPIKKIQNLLVGPQGVLTEAVAKLMGVSLSEAPAIRRIIDSQLSIAPFVRTVVEKGAELKMPEVINRITELYTKENIAKAVKFFMDNAEKAGIDIGGSRLDILGVNPMNALPMLIENRSAFLSMLDKEPLVKEMVDTYVEGNSIINKLRTAFEFPGYEVPVNYFPRQFENSNTFLPYYTKTREFAGANSSFLDAQIGLYDKDLSLFMSNPAEVLKKQYRDAISMLSLQEMAKQNLNFLMNSGSLVARSTRLMKGIRSSKTLNKNVAQIYLRDMINTINAYTFPEERAMIAQMLKNENFSVSYKDGIIKILKNEVSSKLLVNDLLLLQSKIADTFPKNELLINTLRARRGIDDEVFESIEKVVLAGIKKDKKLSDMWKVLPQSYKRIFEAAYVANLPISGWSDVHKFREMIDKYGALGLSKLLEDSENFIALQEQLGILDTGTKSTLFKVFEEAKLIEKNKPLKEMEKIFEETTNENIAKAESAKLSPDKDLPEFDIKSASEETVARRLEKLTGKTGFKLNIWRVYDDIMGFTRKMLTQYSPSLPITSGFGNIMMDWLLNGVGSVAAGKENNLLTQAIVGEMRSSELKAIIDQGYKTQGTGFVAKIFNKLAGIRDEVVTDEALEAIRKLNPENATVLEALRQTRDYRYSSTLMGFGADYAEIGLSHNGFRNYYIPGADKKLGTQIEKLINADPMAFLYLNRYTDTYYKVSIMRNMIRRYGNIDDAVREFDNFFATYKNLTPVEKMFARRISMFYLFQRNNFVNYFKALGTKEGVIKRTQLFFKFVKAMQDPSLKEEFKKLPADDWRKNVLWIGNPDWFILGGNTSLEAALQFGRLFSFLGGDVKGSYQALARNLNIPLSTIIAIGSNTDPKTGQKLDVLSDPYIRNSVQGYEKITNKFMIAALKLLPKQVQDKISFVETKDNNTKEAVYTIDPYINYALSRNVPVPLFNQVTKLNSDPNASIEDYLYLFTALRQQGQADLLKMRTTSQIAESARTEKLMNMYNLGQSVETFTMNPLQKQTAGLPMSIDQYTKASQFASSPLTYQNFNVQYTNTEKLKKLLKKQFKVKQIKPVKATKLFTNTTKLY